MTLDEELLRQARAAADGWTDAQQQASQAKDTYHQTVRRLYLTGASMREIAEALGLSHQRVHQIIETSGGLEAPVRNGPRVQFLRCHQIGCQVPRCRPRRLRLRSMRRTGPAGGPRGRQAEPTEDAPGPPTRQQRPGLLVLRQDRRPTTGGGTGSTHLRRVPGVLRRGDRRAGLLSGLGAVRCPYLSQLASGGTARRGVQTEVPSPGPAEGRNQKTQSALNPQHPSRPTAHPAPPPPGAARNPYAAEPRSSANRATARSCNKSIFSRRRSNSWVSSRASSSERLSMNVATISTMRSTLHRVAEMARWARVGFRVCLRS
jgi:hypothetical protein